MIRSYPEKLLIHCSHHKVATAFFMKIMRDISRNFNWNFQCCTQEELTPDTHFFLEIHSQIDSETLPPYVGSHIIRDLRDMIISGYFYHLWCPEEWCHRPRPMYGGKSYQELLNSVSQDEGIGLEITRSKWSIDRILNWNYSNPNFIEVKLEDLSQNQTQVFTDIFHHYGFSSDEMDKALSIIEALSFEKMSGRKRGEEDRKNHFRKGVSGDWENHFTDEHKVLFKETYPGALAKLGYEPDDNW
jgi:Sulfotransferase domain